jgi:hypothetical protein
VVTGARLDALMRVPLARLLALKTLAMKLKAQEEAIARLQDSADTRIPSRPWASSL